MTREEILENLVNEIFEEMKINGESPNGRFSNAERERMLDIAYERAEERLEEIEKEN